MAAMAAIEYIEPDMVIGIGTGSTIKYFIEELASIKSNISGAISSSTSSTTYLKKFNIPILELQDVDEVPIYIDGADQINSIGQLIKGGGGALTREKIIANASNKFYCIVDQSKYTKAFGTYPVPIEIIPMARSYVAKQCIKIGGTPKLRQNFMTDNGNLILDVDFGIINEPISLEYELNNIPGTVCNGIFGARSADICLVATNDGIQKYSY